MEVLQLHSPLHRSLASSSSWGALPARDFILAERKYDRIVNMHDGTG